jgi:hypothetical protein
MYRGKGALHPAPTGKLTDVVSCVREYDVNIFFLSKDETLMSLFSAFMVVDRKIMRGGEYCNYAGM